MWKFTENDMIVAWDHYVHLNSFTVYKWKGVEHNVALFKGGEIIVK